MIGTLNWAGPLHVWGVGGGSERRSAVSKIAKVKHTKTNNGVTKFSIRFSPVMVNGHNAVGCHSSEQKSMHTKL